MIDVTEAGKYYKKFKKIKREIEERIESIRKNMLNC